MNNASGTNCHAIPMQSAVSISTPSNIAINKDRFEALDGLRAIACILVLIAHFNPWINWQSPLMSSIQSFLPAQIAIITFFCLSSFLITNLLMNEYEKTNKIDIMKFFVKRSLRIWPLYFFIMLCALGVVIFDKLYPHLGAETTAAQWIWFKQHYWQYLTFIGNWWSHALSEFGIMWTICVEEQFYLILPFMAIFVFKHKKANVLVVLTFIILGNLWRIAFIKYPNMIGQHPLYYLTPTYIDSFTYGALSVWLYRKKNNFSFIKSPLFSYSILFVLILCCKLGGTQIWWGPYNYMTVLSYGLMPIGISLFIVQLAINKDKNLGYFLRSNLMKTLGVLSFGIYLWHPLVHRAINIQVSYMKFETTQINEFFFLFLFFEYCLLSVFFAALTFQLVELPFLKVRNAMYKENFSGHGARWILPVKTMIIACILSLATILAIFAMVKLI